MPVRSPTASPFRRMNPQSPGGLAGSALASACRFVERLRQRTMATTGETRHQLFCYPADKRTRRGRHSSASSCASVREQCVRANGDWSTCGNTVEVHMAVTLHDGLSGRISSRRQFDSRTKAFAARSCRPGAAGCGQAANKVAVSGLGQVVRRPRAKNTATAIQLLTARRQ